VRFNLILTHLLTNADYRIVRRVSGKKVPLLIEILVGILIKIQLTEDVLFPDTLYILR